MFPIHHIKQRKIANTKFAFHYAFLESTAKCFSGGFFCSLLSRESETKLRSDVNFLLPFSNAN